MCPASNVCVCIIVLCFFRLLIYVFVSLNVSGRYCMYHSPVCFQLMLGVRHFPLCFRLIILYSSPVRFRLITCVSFLCVFPAYIVQGC